MSEHLYEMVNSAADAGGGTVFIVWNYSRQRLGSCTAFDLCLSSPELSTRDRGQRWLSKLASSSFVPMLQSCTETGLGAVFGQQTMHWIRSSPGQKCLVKATEHPAVPSGLQC